MSLYEITNGYTGESHIRCYAWAESDEAAFGMARDAYRARYGDSKQSRGLTVRKLFTAGDAPFCTMPSDCGWETP